jgi:Ca2+-transporting ATPase
MLGMIDPPRDEVKEAIIKCKVAGIRPIMITGDHPTTAFAIAKQLNIINSDDGLIIGEELEKLSDIELREKINSYNVFARVNPAHKVRIVETFKQLGHVVAMTGDGINDAPSLKKADIGVAMGSGTDVSKEASDLILIDDNFSTIVTSVEEGRHMFLNIKKSILFLLSCNIGEIVTLALALMLLPGMPLPLLPVQILWVNLVTDALPALALGVDPKDNDVMRDKPRPLKESIYAHGGWSFIILNGLLIGTISVVAFRYGFNYNLDVAHTMCFMVLSVSQLFHAFNLRDLNKSILTGKLFKNLVLIITVIISIGLQYGTTVHPLGNLVLGTIPLSFNNWKIVFMLAMTPIIVNEVTKLLSRRA